MKTDFVVKTESFQGPLSTLLMMIEKRKLFINDISLAKVTNDYVRYVAENQETIENKIEFVRVAATLVLAKSKSLLPENISADEQEEINELEDRLRAYKLIKEHKNMLQEIFGTQVLWAISPPKQMEKKSVFSPGDSLDVDLLADKAKKSITTIPKESLPTAEIENKVSLSMEIDRLRDRCRAAGSVFFSSAVRSNSKRDQVVLFVAILELVKGGELTADQEGVFGEITIQHHT